MHRWLREPNPPPMPTHPERFPGPDAASNSCVECGRRMVLVERRDYGSPADVPRVTMRVLKWTCTCGYEWEIGRTPEP